MYKTIGVLAHVDAGKTTFSEQVLFHTNSIQARALVSITRIPFSIIMN